ncbi:M20 family metallo-hydrolase [Paenibacillus sp. FSL H7-0326]|uniref:M20 family metallo-hydrolase n=1 Tax=Paenibacillus sp. FSL H7-0326 TaxID=1921144 RepID=UPI0021164682|nr:M20 family metallo-hydrolase [Paenibacillus sp. FSL H7-0326]
MPDSADITSLPLLQEEALEAYSTLLHKLLDDLEEMSASEAGGCTRLLYSPSWLEAQHYLADFMKERGLGVSFDEAGNLYGCLQGTRNDAPLYTGSHIDTVQSGGKFDGALGVAAGIAALLYLKETYGEPSRSLVALSLSEEEGSRFPFAFWGSRSITGLSSWAAAGELKDAEGITLQQAAEAAGFGPDSGLRSGIEAPAGYVELHIEQGSVLERTNTSIGVVTGIVGQKRIDITVQGEANHAGTTPMSYRKDALAGAAEMISEVRKQAIAYGDPLVATVGNIEVFPGAVNVVPGTAQFTLDIRHTDQAILHEYTEFILQRIQTIADSYELIASSEEHLAVEPTPMNPTWVENTVEICEQLGLSYRKMPSGAGHDAQIFASKCDVAMIFVPSKDGISHNPLEYTSREQIDQGFKVLIELLHQYGYRGKTDEEI